MSKSTERARDQSDAKNRLVNGENDHNNDHMVDFPPDDHSKGKK